MGYVYAALWLAVGLILIFVLSKENKVFYFAGGFFLLMGVWWGLDVYLPEKDLFAGPAGIAFRVLALAMLIVCSVAFYLEWKKNLEKETKSKKDPPDSGK